MNPAGIGAIYARSSTRSQHSIEDQIRSCLERAEAEGITVPEDFTFVDRAQSGRRSRSRQGLNKLRQKVAAAEVDVVIAMLLTRLPPEPPNDEHLVETLSSEVRTIFIADSIDTAEGRRPKIAAPTAERDPPLRVPRPATVKAALTPHKD